MSELPKAKAVEKPRLQLIREPVKHKGILVPKCEFGDIENMNMREDDVWVCTFPRSDLYIKADQDGCISSIVIERMDVRKLTGTTLTQELIYLIQTLDFDKAKSVQLDDRFPVIDVSDDRFPYYRGVQFIEQMASPRMVKSHHHYDFLPKQLQNGKGRIVYLARNPKDVVTSFYNLFLWLDEVSVEDMKSWNAFFQAFVDGTGLYCPWPRHVLRYWERRNDNNLLFLKYEELVEDMPEGVRKIADFLGKSISDNDVAKICEHCFVDNMRKNDKVNMSYWRDVKYVNDNAPGGFINKGKPGTWKERLTVEEAKKVDELIAEVEQFGLTFDYVK